MDWSLAALKSRFAQFKTVYYFVTYLIYLEVRF